MTQHHVGLSLTVSTAYGDPQSLRWTLRRYHWARGKNVSSATLASGEFAPRLPGRQSLDVAIGLLRAALEEADGQANERQD